MRSMKKIDVIAGGSTLLLAVLTWVQARNIPFQNLAGGLGPAFFPILLLVVLSVLGMVSLLLGLFSKVEGHKQKEEKKYFALTISIFGLLFAYGVLFERIGFFLSTLFFLLGTMIILRTQWWQALGLSFLLTGGIYILFIFLFKVPLP
jgi:putative tricarboxylic transport membrane protein